jgi:hypothetical protein
MLSSFNGRKIRLLRFGFGNKVIGGIPLGVGIIK